MNSHQAAGHGESSGRICSSKAVVLNLGCTLESPEGPSPQPRPIKSESGWWTQVPLFFKGSVLKYNVCTEKYTNVFVSM